MATQPATGTLYGSATDPIPNYSINPSTETTIDPVTKIANSAGTYPIANSIPNYSSSANTVSSPANQIVASNANTSYLNNSIANTAQNINLQNKQYSVPGTVAYANENRSPSDEEAIEEQQRNHQNNTYSQYKSSIANRQQSIGNYRPDTTYTGISMNNYGNNHSHDGTEGRYNLSQPAGNITQKKLKGISNIYLPKIIIE